MKSPKGKSELLNKMFSYDFGANWLTLGDGVIIKRVKPHIASLTFPETGRTFELVARIPRTPKPKAVKVANKNGVSIGEAPPPPTARAKVIAKKSPAHARH